MERAARQLSNWIMSRFDSSQNIVVLTGPGNNGGDGWALARLLWAEGYRQLKVFELNGDARLSPDAEINRKRVLEESKLCVTPITSEKDFPSISNSDLLVDSYNFV